MKAKHKDGRVRDFHTNTWNKLSAKEKENWSIEPNEAKKNKVVKDEGNGESGPGQGEGGDDSGGKGSDAPVVLKSKQFTNADAIIKIADMTSKEEIEAFVEGEDRKGITNAVAKRLEELATK